MNKKIVIFLIIIILFPFISISQNFSKEKQLLIQTFNRYKQAILDGKFYIIWDMLLPETQKKLEDACQKIITDPEYKERFISENFGDITDIEKQTLERCSAEDIFIILAKRAQASQSDLDGEEFTEAFKDGVVNKVIVYEVKWLPELKQYSDDRLLDSDIYKKFKMPDSFLEGIVFYIFPDDEEYDPEVIKQYDFYRCFILRDGEWKIYGSPVYIWINEKEEIETSPSSFDELYK